MPTPSLAEKLAKLQAKAAPTAPKFYPLVPITTRERITIPAAKVREWKSLRSIVEHQEKEAQLKAALVPATVQHVEPLPQLAQVPAIEYIPAPSTSRPLSTQEKLAKLGLVNIQLPKIIVENHHHTHIHIHQTINNPDNVVNKTVEPTYDDLKEYLDPTPQLTSPSSTPTVQLKKHEVQVHHLNEDQLLALEYARKGISFCLIGGAGSGKTTTTQLITRELAQSGRIQTLGHGTKHLPATAPSIVFVSFTNPAVSNIKAAVPEEYKSNCLTIHKLTEYEPVYYELEDQPGKYTMRFEPQRTSLNPIEGLTNVVIEESGTVNLDIHETLENAIDGNPQKTYLGDLQQLPPAFGDGILGYKLLELPVVELKKIYRTDDDSPIRKLSYRIQDGFPIRDSELDELVKPGEFELWRYPKLMEVEETIQAMGQHFRKLVLAGDFNPLEDVLLIPYNKLVGTIELGKWIAQAFNEKNGVPVYEIISGAQKVYYAVGDLVYYNKRKCKIVDITNNGSYVGTLPEPASLTLDRWGVDRKTLTAEELVKRLADSKARMEAMFDLTMDQAVEDSSDSPSKRQASHVITLEGTEDDMPPITIQTVGDISGMYFAHTLTVYKAQGSEWNRVFCLFHQCHKTQLTRETLYTAITRARKYLKLYVLGEKSTSKYTRATFYQGMMNQRIPGNTLSEKLKYFRKKLATELMKMELQGRMPAGATLEEGTPIETMQELIKKVMAWKKEQRAFNGDNEDE